MKPEGIGRIENQEDLESARTNLKEMYASLMNDPKKKIEAEAIADDLYKIESTIDRKRAYEELSRADYTWARRATDEENLKALKRIQENLSQRIVKK